MKRSVSHFESDFPNIGRFLFKFYEVMQHYINLASVWLCIDPKELQKSAFWLFFEKIHMDGRTFSVLSCGPNRETGRLIMFLKIDLPKDC